jgi:uncharacterized protein (DUF3820 family)
MGKVNLIYLVEFSLRGAYASVLWLIEKSSTRGGMGRGMGLRNQIKIEGQKDEKIKTTNTEKHDQNI